MMLSSTTLRTRILDWTVLLAVSGLVVARQFSSPHFASCVTDDSILHMNWVQQFAQVLREGVWLPRWLPESNGGYGSPIFMFYSPLVYYVSAFLYWVTGSVVISMKLVRWIGLCMSGWAMLAWAKSYVGHRPALVVALVYVAVPFHVLDVSFWTLYAETWAWIWFPLILLFLRKMRISGKVDLSAVLGFAACYAGLILTHLVSAYMFSFVIAGYVVFGFWEPWKSTKQPSTVPSSNGGLQGHPPGPLQRGNKLRTFSQASIGTMLGLGFAAFFLLPAVVERQFVHLEYSTMLADFNFRNTFLFFPNPAQMAANPFQAKTVALLQVVTLLDVIWLVLSVALLWPVRRLSRAIQWELKFSLGTVLVCLFLMSSASTWLWNLVPGLAQIQFSTRWLSILTFYSCFGIGLGLNSYSRFFLPRSKESGERGAPFTTSIPSWWPKGQVGGRYRHVVQNSAGTAKWLQLAHFTVAFLAGLSTLAIIFGGCFLSKQEEQLAAAGVYNAPEYNPVGMPNWRQKVIEPAAPRYAILKGQAEVWVQVWEAHRRVLMVQAREACRLKLRLLNYPGWRVTVDGVGVTHSVDSASGGMAIEVPQGTHLVGVEFRNTWWRSVALIVSAFAWLGWAGMLAIVLKCRRLQVEAADGRR